MERNVWTQLIYNYSATKGEAFQLDLSSIVIDSNVVISFEALSDSLVIDTIDGSIYNVTVLDSMTSPCSLSIEAYDGIISDTALIILTIMTNNAPVFTTGKPDTLYNLLEGDTLEILLEATDSDDFEDTVTIGVDTLGTLPRAESAALNGSNFKWISQQGDNGSYAITFFATDGIKTTIKTVQVVIKKRNSKPHFIDSINTAVSAIGGDTIVIDLKAADIDSGDVLTMSVSHNILDTNAVTITDSSLVWFSEIPDSGVFTAVAMVSDGKDTTTKTVTITIENGNYKPYFTDTISSVSVVGGDIVEIDLKTADLDLSDELKMSVSHNILDPNAVTITDSSLVWFSKIPDNGAFEVTAIVSDGKDTTVKTISLIVEKGNYTPYFTDTVSSVSAVGGEIVVIDLKTADLDLSDELKMSVSHNILDTNAVTITDSSLVWTSNIPDNGTFTVTATVSDGKDTTAKTVLVIVEKGNYKPYFTDTISTVSAIGGDTIVVDLKTSDLDLSDILTLNISNSIADGNAVTITDSSLIWISEYADSGNFTVSAVVTDGKDSASKDIAINILPKKFPPVIQSASAPQSLVAGETLNLFVSLTGSAPFSYKWQKNGIDIVDKTDSTLSITSIEKADSGAVYKCIATNIAGSDTSDAISLTVYSILTAGNITGTSGVEAEDVSFTVVNITGGTGSYSYQWQKNIGVWNDIAGEESVSLNINSLEMSDAGNYRCIVTSGTQKDTTNEAALIVYATLSFNDIADISENEGEDIAFNVAASGGTGVYGYQWQENDGGWKNLTGQVTSSYSINNLEMSDAGRVRCIVSSGTQRDTTNDALLTVIMNAPVISSHPTSQTKKENSSVTFYVTATGTDLHYEWQRNGVKIIGAADQDSYTRNAAWSDNGALIRCRVYNEGGTINSSSALLGVTYKPRISIIQNDSRVRIDDDLVLSVSVDNANPSTNISYKWYFNNVAISGATSSTYSFNSVEPEQGGTYKVEVSNTEGTTTASENVVVNMEFEDKRDRRVYAVVLIDGLLWLQDYFSYSASGAEYSSTYGRYYYRSHITGGDVIPDGWRLPTSAEYHGVINSRVDGFKALAVTGSQWNNLGTNTTNLSLRPSGRYVANSPIGVGTNGGIWYESGDYLYYCYYTISGSSLAGPT